MIKEKSMVKPEVKKVDKTTSVLTALWKNIGGCPAYEKVNVINVFDNSFRVNIYRKHENCYCGYTMLSSYFVVMGDHVTVYKN